MEIFSGKIIINLRIFREMEACDNLDMEKISDRLRYALLEREISYQRAAKEMGVSRDLIFDYTNPEHSENSMQVETLIRFAEFLGEERYYFCNEYHKFLDQVDVGSLLKKLKKEHNMTRQQFASYLGIPFATYRTYESGKSRIPQVIFDRLKKEMEKRAEDEG